VDTVGNETALVNEQIAFHAKQAKLHASDPYRRTKHTKTAERFQKLLVYITALETQVMDLAGILRDDAAKQLDSALSSRARQRSLTPEDIKDLPDELIKELSLNAADHTEFAIVSLIDESGGMLSLDRLLIGLYKKTKEIHKRQALIQRLYRMAQKQLVFTVPGKKGVYSTREIDQEEADRLFGGGPDG
jgi:hypothetical protein